MATVLERTLSEYKNRADLYIHLITSTHAKEQTSEQFSENIKITRVPVRGGCLHHATNLDLMTFFVRALFESIRAHSATPFHASMGWSTVPAGAVSLCLKVFCGIPYLVRLTGPDIPGFEVRYERIYPFLSPILKRIWNSASIIIAKCSDEADLLTRTYRRKIPKIIPNGCSVSSNPAPRRFTERGPLRLLCVARLIERKGHFLLFQALETLKSEGIQFFLTLVGQGDLEADLKRHVNNMGLSSSVHFEGYVERSKLSEMYRSHDIFILPSLRESMSVAALEALAAGSPLILSEGGGSERLVEAGRNGAVVNVKTSSSLVEALREFDKNRERLPEYSQESFKKSRQFSWETCANNLFSEIHATASETF